MATKRETRKLFTLRIELDNDAFGDEPEVELSRLLASLSGRFHPDGGKLSGNKGSGHLHDMNGNKVGEWIIAEHKNLRFTR